MSLNSGEDCWEYKSFMGLLESIVPNKNKKKNDNYNENIWKPERLHSSRILLFQKDMKGIESF